MVVSPTMATSGEQNLASLDRAIMQAHARGETLTLARSYHAAGQALLAGEDVERAGFVLTQAYIFALESGDDGLSREIWQWLKDAGRES